MVDCSFFFFPALPGPQRTLKYTKLQCVPSPPQDQVAVYINYKPSVVGNNLLLSFHLKAFNSVKFIWIRCTWTPHVINISHHFFFFFSIRGCYLIEFPTEADGLTLTLLPLDSVRRRPFFWTPSFFLFDDGGDDPPGVRLSLCLNMLSFDAPLQAVYLQSSDTGSGFKIALEGADGRGEKRFCYSSQF